MTISRTAFLVSIVILASSCATPSQRTKGSGSAVVASAAEGKTQHKSPPDGYDHVVCDIERTVGSMIPETVCRSVEMTEQNRRRTQDDLNRMLQRAGSSPGSGN